MIFLPNLRSTFPCLDCLHDCLLRSRIGMFYVITQIATLFSNETTRPWSDLALRVRPWFLQHYWSMTSRCTTVRRL